MNSWLRLVRALIFYAAAIITGTRMHYAEFDCRHGLDHEQNGTSNDERPLNFDVTFITPNSWFPRYQRNLR
jgi:hypothetical protein